MCRWRVIDPLVPRVETQVGPAGLNLRGSGQSLGGDQEVGAGAGLQRQRLQAELGEVLPVRRRAKHLDRQPGLLRRDPNRVGGDSITRLHLHEHRRVVATEESRGKVSPGVVIVIAAERPRRQLSVERLGMTE